MTQKIIDHKIYDSCGNIIGVTVIDGISQKELFEYSIESELRVNIVKIGKLTNCDSMMLMHTDLQNPATIVFEPNGGENGLGAFSTMCGNGIRAVALYLQNRNHKDSQSILTKSGLLITEKIPLGFEVAMGKLYEDEIVSRGYALDKDIPSSISPDRFEILGIALTCNPTTEVIDGEPHLILLAKDYNLSITDLYSFAERYGQQITKNLNLFPEEINVSLISITTKTKMKLECQFLTHERNLGNDAKRSITKACGTGSTVAAGLLFNRFQNNFSTIELECLGGRLNVRRSENEILYLGGSVHEIKS